MHLSELKALHVSDLITMGEALEIENVTRLRKQELMFAIMKKDRKSTRLNSSHSTLSRMPSSA